ncbi:OPA3 domain protein [Rutstroemia sp. NJR-2017a BBW]|nr:OPA3 domain protein [Rutstroemia sp. NJR-2017a BBW]
MVALPLFKLGSLLVRHISKYGANWIKRQAHEHEKFRVIAAKYGQAMHQWNMRIQVNLLRDKEAEKKARERAGAATVKTEEQMKAEETSKKAHHHNQQGVSVWRRKFRPLPEGRAVDLFADVVGDTFILSVAISLLMYEYLRQQAKPDANAEKLAELEKLEEELNARQKELEEAQKQQQERVAALEQLMLEIKNSSGKKKWPLAS